MKTTKPITSHSTNSALGNCRIDPSRNDGLIRKPFLLKILAVALMGASLALFLCAAGGVLYGDSEGLKPLSLTVDTHYYPTFGTPNDALVTADDAYVLVSVSVARDFGATGVQVFRKTDFTNPCGGQQILNFPPPRPSGPALQTVDGMKFFPGPLQVSVGAAVEAHGAEFFRLASLNQPCAIDGIVNVPQLPVISNCPSAPNCSPGSFDLVVTPDGEYAFVANEYGVINANPGVGGTIGIIRIQRDDVGRFTRGTRSIEQNNTIYIPGGSTIPGVTMSHDGRYLYVTCEGSIDGINRETGKPYRDPTNVQNGEPNGTILCPGCRTSLKECDNESKGDRVNNGLLTVIDVDKATRGMGQASIITTIASGCSPVRSVETENGQYIWVAARGKNQLLPPHGSGYQVLAFDVSKLVSGFPNDALVGYGDSGGTAPVGMELFNNDSLLAVANSNRFFDHRECVHPPPGAAPCTANVAILDVSNPSAPTVQHIIRNEKDAFPRNVTLGPDGSTLYVPNAGCDAPTSRCQSVKRLEVITTSVN